MFYTFSQNNSGGVFDINTSRGISVNVIVEADNSAEAMDRAELIGLYFDGVDSGPDCSCCGDRWYAPWSDDGTESPSYYDQPLADIGHAFVHVPGVSWFTAWAGDDPDGYVHFKNGTVKPVIIREGIDKNEVLALES